MFNDSVKTGKLLTVSGTSSGIGSSTAAALLASTLAANGERTLLLSTDPEQPFDAISISTDSLEENNMDDLVILENSNGLTPKILGDYVTFITDNLAVCRASTAMSKLAKRPTLTLTHIIDAAKYSFSYIVLDMNYTNTPNKHLLYGISDAVMAVFGQKPKDVARAKDAFKHDRFGKDMLVVPVIANFVEYVPVDDAFYERELKMDTVFAMNHDNAVYDAVSRRDVAMFVARAIRATETTEKTGKRKLIRSLFSSENSTVNAYAMVTEKIADALKAEGGNG